MGEKLTVIDGKQYREVQQFAKVGDKIRSRINSPRGISIGDIFTVTSTDHTLSDGTRGAGFTDTAGRPRAFWSITEYVVLEPVETAEKSANPADIREIYSLVDGLTQSVASLTLRVTELERKASEKKSIADMTVKVNVDASDITALAERLRNVKTRDEIVEQAKKDVAELIKRYTGTRSEVRFVVNRDKRTVVALRYYDGDVDNRGKSRCAPGDCFNSAIGRAISLRRALGLTVPDEYYSAPTPTEVRVGDVVKCCEEAVLYSVTSDFTLVPDELSLSYAQSVLGSPLGVVISDDSREEVSA